MRKRLLVSVALCVLAAILISGCSEPVPVKNVSSEKIKIGLILPQKGDFATYGLLCKNAIDLAVDEVNSRGGIAGRDIEAIPGDDASIANVAASITQQYTQIQKVSAIVGPYTTESSLTGAPVANRDGVPMIAIRASEPSVTQIGKYIFRACYVDIYQGTLLGQFAGKDLKAKKAAVIYNTDDQDAKLLIDNFKNKLKEYGCKVESVQTYDGKVNDYTSLVKELGVVRPDVVLLPDFEDRAGLIIKEIAKAGIKTTFLGTDLWKADNLIKIAGKDAEGSYFSSHFSPEDPNKTVQEFVDLYEGDFGIKPGPTAALAYDAMNLVIEAMKQSKSTEPAKIRDALANIRNFKGVTGTFKFDEDRNPIKGGVILKVERDGVVFEKRIEP